MVSENRWLCLLKSKPHCIVKVGLIFIHVLLKKCDTSTKGTIDDDTVLKLIHCGFTAWPQ